MHPNPDQIGSILRKYRIQARLAQKTMAMYVNIDNSLLSKYETGSAVPPPSVLRNIINVLRSLLKVPNNELVELWSLAGYFLDLESELIAVKSFDSPTGKRPLRVFLSHSSQDKIIVRTLYHQLITHNIIVWFDEVTLLGGQDWQHEILAAVKSSDVILVCLSRKAIGKAGFLHKEIKMALDVYEEQPEGTIFLIPIRLDECDIPNRLSHLQWINNFESDGFEKLMLSLKNRADSIA